MSSHTGVIAILTTRKNTTQLLKPKKTVKLWALALQKHGGCGWRRRTPSIRPSGRRSLDCWMSRREVAEAKEEDRRLMHHFEAVEPPETWYVLLVLPIRLYYVRMHSGPSCLIHSYKCSCEVWPTGELWSELWHTSTMVSWSIGPSARSILSKIYRLYVCFKVQSYLIPTNFGQQHAVQNCRLIMVFFLWVFSRPSYCLLTMKPEPHWKGNATG